jgi:hypothetical protein
MKACTKRHNKIQSALGEGKKVAQYQYPLIRYNRLCKTECARYPKHEYSAFVYTCCVKNAKLAQGNISTI